MATHSIAEATEHLPELVERALAGEAVVITRDGRAVVALRPVERQPAGPVTADALAWLDRLRVVPAKPQVPDAATLIRQMRDEGP